MNKQVITVGPEQDFFNRIMNSRERLSLAHAGQKRALKVSNVTYGVVANLGSTGRQAVKDIYNFAAYKAETADRPEFKARIREAILAERSGDSATAKEIFGDLLNECQLTFGLINNDGMAYQASKGEIVHVQLGSTEVEDKEHGGERTTLIVSTMTPVPVSHVAASKGFSYDDVLIEEEPEEELKSIAKPAAAKKAVVKP
jgi:hypothetical protein